MKKSFEYTTSSVPLFVGIIATWALVFSSLAVFAVATDWRAAGAAAFAVWMLTWVKVNGKSIIGG